ncbi:peptidase domain-containing ABC transporter [Rhizobium sp.]|uniref:peptidase domain-containing ABC transporter n=1 Tax=Rhizobium sp. TaxID=391 RepID=UPI0028B0FFA6
MEKQPLDENPASFSWFTKTTGKYTGYIIELSVLSIVLRLLGLVQPFVFQALIDRILPFQREDSLYIVVALLVVVAFFQSAFKAISIYLGGDLVNQLTREFSKRIYTHVLHLPLRTLQKWQVGELFARMREIETIRNFLTGTISGVVIDILFSFIYLGALFSISPSLTLVIVLILPTQMAAIAIVGPFLRHRLKQSFMANAAHQSRMIETFRNAETVKAQAAEERFASRLDGTMVASLDLGFKIIKLHAVNGIIGDVFSNAFNILIIFFGAMLVLDNSITLGQLVAFHLLAGHVSAPILGLASLWEHWQGIKIARIRLGDVLNAPSEAEMGKQRLILKNPATVRLESVSFGYTADRPVIDNLSLTIAPGKPTVIIGRSGFGKSTLAKIMGGLYPPTTGTVFIDDQALNNFTPQSIRSNIGYLPQEAALFAGSIRENLFLAKSDATDAEMHAALRDSACTDMIEQLPAGMDTDVGEQGFSLSGGQRQRLALARLLMLNPNVLIVDEPTSALDERSTSIVISTLSELAKSRAVVIISHRPDLFGTTGQIVDLEQLQARA